MLGELARGKEWRQGKRDSFVFYDELSIGLRKQLPDTPGTNKIIDGTMYKVRSGQFGDILVYKEMPRDIKRTIKERAVAVAQTIKSGFAGAQDGSHSEGVATLTDLANRFGSECQGMLIEAFALRCHELAMENEKLQRKLGEFTASAHTLHEGKTALVTITCDPMARDFEVKAITYEISGNGGEGQNGGQGETAVIPN